MADLEPDDIEVAELHDMFTILEFLQSEGIGVAEQGHGLGDGDGWCDGKDGELPIDTSGGLNRAASAGGKRRRARRRITNSSSARPGRDRSRPTPHWRVTSAGSETVSSPPSWRPQNDG